MEPDVLKPMFENVFKLLAHEAVHNGYLEALTLRNWDSAIFSRCVICPPIFKSGDGNVRHCTSVNDCSDQGRLTLNSGGGKSINCSEGCYSLEPLD